MAVRASAWQPPQQNTRRLPSSSAASGSVSVTGKPQWKQASRAPAPDAAGPAASRSAAGGYGASKLAEGLVAGGDDMGTFFYPMEGICGSPNRP